MDRENFDMKNVELFTIGVEEEYMICNPVNGELIAKVRVTTKDNANNTTII